MSLAAFKDDSLRFSSRIYFVGTSAATPCGTRGFSCFALGTTMDGSTAKEGGVGRKQLEGKVESFVLFDCGDGAVHGLVRNGIDVNKISAILVSHMHSDHVSGLTSIIETMGIFSRSSDLLIVGPSEIIEYFEIVEKITRVAKNRKFTISVREAENQFTLPYNKSDNIISIKTFQMDHTIPALGYRVSLKDETGLLKEFAYSGDTQPCENSANLANNVSLLIHEATFLHKDKQKAVETKHTTVKEAAQIARDARSKKLILTHINCRYEKIDDMLLEEARSSFQDVTVATDGLVTYLLP
jgi:ribonuclease Z